jgi:hypothetical protein
MNYIIYDQLHLESTFNFEITQEVLIGTVNNMTIVTKGEPLNRKVPIFSDFNMDPSDYANFFTVLDDMIYRMYKYSNEEIFGNGVPLPY